MLVVYGGTFFSARLLTLPWVLILSFKINSSGQECPPHVLKINSSGQECPLHTFGRGLRFSRKGLEDNFPGFCGHFLVGIGTVLRQRALEELIGLVFGRFAFSPCEYALELVRDAVHGFSREA